MPESPDESEASGALVLMLESDAHLDLAGLPDELAGDLGRLTVHLLRAIETLPHVARAHVSRWGDGSEHLHLWFYARPPARPAGQRQLRGTFLAVWDDLLPTVPEAMRRVSRAAVPRCVVGDAVTGHAGDVPSTLGTSRQRCPRPSDRSRRASPVPLRRASLAASPRRGLTA